jgi:hypothetical protein
MLLGRQFVCHYGNCNSDPSPLKSGLMPKVTLENLSVADF